MKFYGLFSSSSQFYMNVVDSAEDVVGKPVFILQLNELLLCVFSLEMITLHEYYKVFAEKWAHCRGNFNWVMQASLQTRTQLWSARVHHFFVALTHNMIWSYVNVTLFQCVCYFEIQLYAYS